MVTTPSSKGKSSRKAPPVSAGPTPMVERGRRLDEHLIRERAYGIWLEEGRPHGRDLAHWRRAHEELQQQAR